MCARKSGALRKPFGRYGKDIRDEPRLLVYWNARWVRLKSGVSRHVGQWNEQFGPVPRVLELATGRQYSYRKLGPFRQIAFPSHQHSETTDWLCSATHLTPRLRAEGAV